MKLSTQFKAILFVFAIVLIVATTSIVVTSQQVARARAQERLANEIVQGASDLTYLTNDYAIYQGKQQLIQWQNRYASFSNDVGNLSVDTAEQQAIVTEIQTTKDRMKTVFDSIVSLSGTSQNQNVPSQTLQASWSRMAIQTQSLIGDANQLSQLLRTEVDGFNSFNFIIIFSTIIAFSLLLFAIYLQTFRRTLRSISKLQAGTDIIGKGNLDYKLEESHKDEIDDLSRAFNRMTTNLKAVTASKADLEHEIDDRKKAEIALKDRNEQLELLQRKLEEKATEVEEYASQMEHLAEERALKLKDAERLAAIGATAGMVGHDIRNPLQSITSDLYIAKTELESLPENESKNAAIESMNEIETNIDYINKIVADLQDYARPLNPRAQESNIASIINETLSKQKLTLNLKVEVDVADNAQKIMADPDYIKRIVNNLVLNAIQAMPDGGKLTVRTVKEQPSRDIILTVEDTGVGIPEEVKDKLFTPMFTTKSKGQGFGLAVVKRMTETLGGTVTFESEPGRGTKFIIRFPPPKKNQG